MNIIVLTKYTIKEILSSKILYLSFILSFFIIVISLGTSGLSYGVPERVALDVGLGLVSLSLTGICIFLGVSLVKNELDDRSVYSILSRPIYRWEYILAKFFGLAVVLLFNLIILALTTYMLYLKFDGEINSYIIWVFIFNYLESLILLSFVILSSLIANKVITVLSSILFYCFCYFVVTLKTIKFLEDDYVLKAFSDFLYFILPDFNQLNLKQYVLYKTQIDLSVSLQILSTNLVYLFVLLISSIWVMENKNLD